MAQTPSRRGRTEASIDLSHCLRSLYFTLDNIPSVYVSEQLKREVPHYEDGFGELPAWQGDPNYVPNVEDLPGQIYRDGVEVDWDQDGMEIKRQWIADQKALYDNNRRSIDERIKANIWDEPAEYCQIQGFLDGD